MLQIVASASSAYSIPWPPSFNSLLSTLRVFLVDVVSITRTNCAQPMNYYGSLMTVLIGTGSDVEGVHPGWIVRGVFERMSVLASPRCASCAAVSAGGTVDMESNDAHKLLPTRRPCLATLCPAEGTGCCVIVLVCIPPCGVMVCCNVRDVCPAKGERDGGPHGWSSPGIGSS